MHVLPCPLPVELVEGEHFILADFLKLISESSSQVESAPKPLVRPDCLPLFVQDPKPTQLPLAERDSQPAPQATKKKKKKTGQTKVVGMGLEGFVDWTYPTVSQSAEEREVEMSSLVAGFFARMGKCVASAQGETTLSFEGSGDKRFKKC